MHFNIWENMWNNMFYGTLELRKGTKIKRGEDNSNSLLHSLTKEIGM